MMYWDGWGGGWMWFGGIGMIVFWGLIVWLVVWLTRRASHRGSGLGTPDHKTPLDIAKERYAKGEITLEQLEEMKKNL